MKIQLIAMIASVAVLVLFSFIGISAWWLVPVFLLAGALVGFYEAFKS